MSARRVLVLGALWAAAAAAVVQLCRAAAVEREQDPFDTTWMGGPV